MAPKPVSELVLPLTVTSPTDIGRLLRELDVIDNLLMQYDLKGATDQAKMPQTTLLMDSFIDANKYDLTDPPKRKQAVEFLQKAQADAPVLHISFGSDPSTAFIGKLVTWLRREIHPQVLVTIGLQPSIGAGCLVRSTNKYFDFSLRQNFTKKREILLEKLHEVNAA